MTLEKEQFTPESETLKRPTAEDLKMEVERIMAIFEKSKAEFEALLGKFLEYEKGFVDEERKRDYSGWYDEDFETLRESLLQKAYGEDEKSR